MGRPRGSLNKRSLSYHRTTGDMPLDYMLRVMRDENQPQARRDEMAKSAAPYLHAKLQATQITGEITTRYVAEMPIINETIEEWHNQYAPKAIQ